MLANESGSSDREKSPSLVRSNNEQGRRRKEISPKVGEPLKEHPKRKIPKSCSKSSSDRSTDEERGPSPKRRSKKSKGHRPWSKKDKKKKHRRYSSSPSPSSSSNDDSEESKYRNNEGKESRDFRFRVVSEEDQYKYSLPPDMAQ